MKRGESGTALVTGAAGFAGKHLVAELESSTNWEIVGLTRKAVRIGDRTRPVACDLRDAELLLRVIQRYRPGVIFHLAAQSYVPKSIADPRATLSNNILGQVNLLEAVLDAEIQPRILVVSSSEIYGAVQPSELPIDECAALKPANPYAVSKATQDLLGYQYVVTHGLDIVRARPFNHSGPGQSDRFVLSGFARQIAEAEIGKVEPTILTGNLDAKRDFLDVRDVVRAYLLMLEDGKRGDFFNVASGVPRRIGDLLETLVARSRVPLTTRIDPARMRPSDVPVIFGSSKALRERTGWSPDYPIEQTLADTLDYWRRSL
ncbi:GDP-mannose 4,6-dehydratase [soil metagenome]